MAGNATYNKRIQVYSGTRPTGSNLTAASGSSFLDLPESSGSLDELTELIDSTIFSTEGGRMRNAGLRDASVTIECLHESGNTGLSTVRSALTGRSNLWIRYCPVLAVSEEAVVLECKPESYSRTGDVAGNETISISLQLTTETANSLPEVITLT